MIDINGGELIVLFVVAVIVIGPTRLPGYAEQLGGWIRQLRVFLRDAKRRVDEELGDDLDVDWAALDPRKYDPRRIVRDALLEDEPVAVVPGRRTPRHPSPRPARASAVAAGATTPAAAAVAQAADTTADGPTADETTPEPDVLGTPAATPAASTTTPSAVDGILVDDEAT